MFFDKHANLCGKLASFKEELAGFVINDDGTIEGSVIEYAHEVPDEQLNPTDFEPSFNIAHVYDAIIMGIRDYFVKMNFKKAILGSSGGIDSAVTLALAC